MSIARALVLACLALLPRPALAADDCVWDAKVLGCPLPDRDGDAVVDLYDHCPAQPEARNGYQDEDGCPDELPPSVASFGTLRAVLFDSRGTKPHDRGELASYVQLLGEFAGIDLELSGHTDTREARTPEDRVELARRRAEAVRAELVARGVDPRRLIVRAAGDAEPLDTNRTARGRRYNRRVEFRIIVQ
jgi:OOP family OmpA-OmpF porin